MSDAMKAADDLKVLANRLRPLFDVADVLERIGSLEQAEREAGIRLQKTKDAEEEAKNVLDDRVRDLSKAEQKVEEALEKSVQIENAAQTKSDKIIEAADSRAIMIIRNATDQKKVLDAEIISKRGQLAQIQEAIDAKNEELSNLKREIEAAREKIAAFMKG